MCKCSGAIEFIILFACELSLILKIIPLDSMELLIIEHLSRDFISLFMISFTFSITFSQLHTNTPEASESCSD